MPYIIKAARQGIDERVQPLIDWLTDLDVGQENYALSKIIWSLFERKPSYSRAAGLISTLEAVKLEFYRRKVAPYEDKKREENGDVKTV